MADLPKRTLGRTGFEATVLGYGAMELRDKPRGREVSEEDAARILNAALDSGINFVDTSIDYGISEERIGRHISHRRDEYFLASKCGCLVGWEPTEEKGGPHEYNRDNIVKGVEQSLTRLKTDRLDLVQVHMTPSKKVLEENNVVETLKDLQQQGKVRFIGMSGTIPNLADHIAMGVFDAFQIPYSAIQREHEDLVSEAAKSGAGIIIRGGAGRGTPSGDERARERSMDLASVWDRTNMDDLLQGMSPMEFTLRFTISHPDMTTTIVGTLNPAHLAGNIEAIQKGPLPKDLYEEAKRRLAEAGTAPVPAGAR
ncbi:MAG: aldo/keto reductase [Dehalococcoidia bacterium]